MLRRTLLLLALLALVPSAALAQAPLDHVVTARVYFSPRGGCQSAVVNEINRAQRLIRVRAYEFTADAIAYALVNARYRGVTVELLVHKTNETDDNSVVPYLYSAVFGIPVKVDVVSGIAHSKVLQIDDDEIVTGSYNFTTAAEERNAENLLILHGAELAADYRLDWEKHWAAGRAFNPH